MSADPRDGVSRAGRHDGGMRPRRAGPLAAGLALGAVADLVLADPRRGHPVAGFGRTAAALERRAWRDSRAVGTAYAAVCVGTATAVGAAAQRLTAGRPLARTAL